MSETATLGISASAIIITIIGWIYEHTKVIGELKAKNEAQEAEITSLKLTIARLDTCGTSHTNEAISKMYERLTSLEVKAETSINEAKLAREHASKTLERMSAIEVKMDLWWKSVQDSMIDLLHHPITPQFDRLLEAQRDGNITPEDRQQLINTLKEIDKSSVPSYFRAASRILLRTIASQNKEKKEGATTQP